MTSKYSGTGNHHGATHVVFSVGWYANDKPSREEYQSLRRKVSFWFHERGLEANIVRSHSGFDVNIEKPPEWADKEIKQFCSELVHYLEKEWSGYDDA